MEHVSAHPLDIGLIGTYAVALEAKLVAHAIQPRRFSHIESSTRSELGDLMRTHANESKDISGFALMCSPPAIGKVT